MWVFLQGKNRYGVYWKQLKYKYGDSSFTAEQIFIGIVLKPNRAEIMKLIENT